MSAVADVLNGAADLIERDGWVQGIAQDIHTGSRCAFCAVLDAGGPDEETRWAAVRAFRDTLGRHITAWNDDPGRTKDEVVAAIRAAAERAA